MNTVYVVLRGEGSYEDYRQSMVRGFPTRERADACVEAEKIKDARYNELIKPASTAWREWFKATPFTPAERMLETPKMQEGWKSKDIPPEFKAERNRVGKENEARSWRNHEAQAEWDKHAEVAAAQILRDLGATEEELKQFNLPLWSSSEHDYSYDVEILEVEE